MTGYEFLAEQKARERGLDPFLVKGVIQQESAGNPFAVGPPTKWGKARGLMQLIPATGGEYGLHTPEDFFNPEKNISAGTTFLAKLSKRYEGQPDQVEKTLAAYNWGPGNVPVNQPFSSFFHRMPAETRDYVTKITGRMGQPLSAHQPSSPRSLFDLTRRDIRPATALPPDPSRQTELRQSQPPGMFENIYNYVFGTENEGLPPAKTWPGPDVGEPPDQISTGDLATLGLLAMSGMGAALPTTVGRVLPSMLQTSPARAIGNLALGTGGSTAGREIGEAVAGETGGNIGAGIGGLLGLPTKKPPVIKSDIYSIPAEGPLAGTKVLTREGLARPTMHGTRAAYKDVKLTPKDADEYLAYGPGYYATTNARVTEDPEYVGVLESARQKLVRQSENKGAQEQKKALIARARFRQTLTPEEQSAFDSIDWKNSRWEAITRNVLEPTFKRFGIDESKEIPARTPEGLNFYSQYQKLLNTHNMASAFSRETALLKDRIQKYTEKDITPNTRPAYLNIKRPLDVDTSLSKKDIQDVMSALTRRKVNSTPGQADWEFSSQIAKSLDQTPPRRGDDLYLELRDVVGATEASKILQEAGFDGITHIGYGPNAGNMRTNDPADPRRSRVWIAFREDQIHPYFDPKFTKAQEKQKLDVLKRSIKALREQNALLKGEAITTEANPRGFAQNPYIPVGTGR